MEAFSWFFWGSRGSKTCPEQLLDRAQAAFACLVQEQMDLEELREGALSYFATDFGRLEALEVWRSTCFQRCRMRKRPEKRVVRLARASR